MTVQSSAILASRAIGDRMKADHGNFNVSADDLRDLMQAVTDTTQRLQHTHLALQNEVKRLQHELAQANAALRRSQALAALGEMAAGIAHEVRNPLGSIQLYAQLLAEDLADRPEQATLCSKISSAVTGLDSIVKDVLAFARDAAIDPHPIFADDVIDRTLIHCASLLQKGVKIMRPESNARLRLHADINLLTQALGNIIRNAVEAMTDVPPDHRLLRLCVARKRVRCATGGQERRIAFIVHDNGPGIPAEVRDRIFNPFFTTRKTGTGLGLAIVHRIIDAHGGEVLIDNHPTGGAIVQLCLPIHPPQTQVITDHRQFQINRTEPAA